MPNNTTEEISKRLLILASKIVHLLQDHDGRIENLNEDEHNSLSN